jgi:hypothetical protein
MTLCQQKATQSTLLPTWFDLNEFLMTCTMGTLNFHTGNKMIKKFLLLAVITIALPACFAQSVDFVTPKNGAVLKSPFKVVFEVKGMTVAPAGSIADGTGHHHLLINSGPVPEGISVPFDETHLHFGKGQTETDVTLPPGHYKLTMQFANGVHQSYGEKMSKSIEVTVK